MKKTKKAAEPDFSTEFFAAVQMLSKEKGVPEDALLEGIQPDGTISEAAKKQTDALLHQRFRPEFLNRLDEIILYKPLTKQEIGGIVDLLIAGLQKRLAEQQITVRLTDAAKDAVIEQGYDPNFGARPLKRLIQRKIETLLAKKLLSSPLPQGSTVTVDFRDGAFVCE